MDPNDFDEDTFVERTCPECGETNKIHMHDPEEEDIHCCSCGEALPSESPCENCGKYRASKLEPTAADLWSHRQDEKKAGKKLPARWDHSCRCLDEVLYEVTLAVYFRPDADEVSWAVSKGLELEKVVDDAFKEYCMDAASVGSGVIDEKNFKREGV